MRKRKIILIHLTLFIALSLVLFFTAESILNILLPGLYDVLIWLKLIIYGTIGILILTTISCLIFLKKGTRKERIEKVELAENGFLINYDGEITKYKWSEINKLTGFKIDRFTIDDICLKIESDEKESIATEEFEGWRNFMNSLLNEFPEIDKNWEGIIAKPPFERNETELFNRNKTLGNNV